MANQCKENNVHSVGYNVVAGNDRCIRLAVLLPPKSVKSREIFGKIKLIAVQGHPRSSTLVPFKVHCATSY